jgi:hypothetical protein
MVAHRIVFFVGFMGWLSIPSSRAGATNPVPADPSNHNETIRQLVEQLAVDEPKWEYPDDSVLPGSDAAEKFLAEQRIRYGRQKDEIQKGINQLASLGDSVIDLLLERIRGESDDLRVRLLTQRFASVLKGINTPKAQQILADMVFHRGAFRNMKWVCGLTEYLDMVKADTTPSLKHQAVELLADNRLSMSSKYEVMNAINGVDVDDKLLGYLNPRLTGPSFYLRQDSLNLLAADPSPEKADDKLRSILQSMQTIEKMQIPLGDSTAKAYDRCQYDRPGTYADVLFDAATNALIQVKTPKQIFAEQTDSLSGMPRYWALTARANRSDSSVHDELKTIVSDPNQFPRMRLRQLGVQAFSKIGTPIDIPWLKQIAASDPYRIHLYLSSSKKFEWVNETMVNNTGPRASMLPEDEITPRTVSYPIRSAAQEAIKAIEAKTAKTTSVPLGESSKSP